MTGRSASCCTVRPCRTSPVIPVSCRPARPAHLTSRRRDEDASVMTFWMIVRMLVAGFAGPRYLLCLIVLGVSLAYALCNAFGWFPAFSVVAGVLGVPPLLLPIVLYLAVHLGIGFYWV